MTAPHGPSDGAGGFLHRWKNLVRKCEYAASTGNEALHKAAREALWALEVEHAAEVRAAVVAECVAADRLRALLSAPPPKEEG